MLTADDRLKVAELFHTCAEMEGRNRDAFYLAHDVRPEIQDEVERLIRNHHSGTESRFRPVRSVRELLNEIPPLFGVNDLIGGRFTVLEFIRRGGMGEVYRARESSGTRDGSGAIVALKVIRPVHGSNAETIRRFRREFDSQSRIAHPNVCHVFELLTHDAPDGPVDFFTMELLPGKSLAATFREEGVLPQPRCKQIATGVLQGLIAAHAQGIAHRDLKPSNIMLIPDDGVTNNEAGCRAVLLDFGLAWLNEGGRTDTTLTRTGQALGTLDYMSPEQFEGARADTRSDLYSFGLIVFEMLTRRHPFRDGESAVPLAARGLKPGAPILNGGFADGTPFNREWHEVIAACLQPDPRDRADSAETVLALLEGRARRSPFRLPVRMQRRAAIGAILTVAAGVGLTYWQRHKLGLAKGVAVLIADDSASDPITASAVNLQVRNLMSRSGFLTVWNPASLGDVWKRMGRSMPPAPSERDWREIAFREHVGLVVFLSTAGSSVTVRVQQVQGGPEKAWREWTKRFDGRSEDDLLAVLESAEKWVRDLAGESAGEIANSSGVDAVTTSSWRALIEFSRGEELASKRELENALLAFAAALRLDADFTMAWMRRGDIELSLGREREAFTAWKGAVDSAQRRPLSRREDLKFRAMLSSDGEDWETSQSLFAEYQHYFPDDWFGVYYREFPLMMLGRVDEALAELERTLAFPDRRGRAHMKFAWALAYKGDMERARQHSEELKKMSQPALAGWADAVIHYMENNSDAALDALERAAKDPQMVSTTMHEVYQINVLADGERTEQAIKLAFDRASVDLRQGRHAERATKIIGGAALLADKGDRRESLRQLATVDVSALGPHRAADMVALLARLDAHKEAKNLSELLIVDLPYPRFQVARLRSDGELALAAGNKQAAVDLMTRAAALDSRAYGKQYLAYAREKAGDRQTARAGYQDHLRCKAFQLHSQTPEPAGSWRRSLNSIKRLT